MTASTRVNPLTPGGSGPRGASASSTKAEILILVRQVESEIQAQKKLMQAAEAEYAQQVQAFEAEEAAIEKALASAAENKRRAEENRKLAEAAEKARLAEAEKHLAEEEEQRREQLAVLETAKAVMANGAAANLGAAPVAGGSDGSGGQDGMPDTDRDGTVALAQQLIAENMAKAKRAKLFVGKRDKLWHPEMLKAEETLGPGLPMYDAPTEVESYASNVRGVPCSVRCCAPWSALFYLCPLCDDAAFF